MGGISKADKATARSSPERARQSAESGSRKPLRNSKAKKTAAVEQTSEDGRVGRTSASHHNALLAGAQLLCGMMKGMLGKPAKSMDEAGMAKARSEQRDMQVKFLCVCTCMYTRVYIDMLGKSVTGISGILLGLDRVTCI
jgi:hypothetical protein